MSASPLRKPGAPVLRGTDLRGLHQLGVDAVVGVTDLVEAMHHTIASGAGIVGRAPAGRTRGITGMVYGSVRGTTRVVGRGVDALIAAWPARRAPDGPSRAREATIAALNGVWGDHLASTGNPLAIGMSLRMGGLPVPTTHEGWAARGTAPSRRLLILVHGLCMSDLQWTHRGQDHGQALACELGFTPLYLHYNSGRHVWQNGREFAALLDDLIARWPVQVDELVIVGHSMGGLVARSACHEAARAGHAWPATLAKMVFLGTPHHGAPLERGGRHIDRALGLSPYVAPFARLGRSRSAGITDLRFGNVRECDRPGSDRHAQHRDDRPATPLPAGVDSYLLAATTADRARGLQGAVIGDGLVPVDSALGRHRNPSMCLRVPSSHQRLVTGCSHLGLLDNAEVLQQLLAWLR